MMLEKYPTFKELGVHAAEIVPGETITLYEPKCIHFKLHSNRYEEVRLILTDYKIYLIDTHS